MTLDLTWVFNLVLYLIIGSIAVVGIMNSVLFSFLLGVGISVLSTIYPLMVIKKMTVRELLSF
jgi:hypothetical protein